MIDPHRELIQKFYTCFQQKNFKGMQDCYHSRVEFSDPAFGLLKGNKAKAMWHILLSGSTEIKIVFNDIETSGNAGSCFWEAIYLFPSTGRLVHNRIKASFLFEDGLIIRHTDRFNFWRWSFMAFGLNGLLLGWTPFFKKKVRTVLHQRLSKFIDNHAAYQ